MRLVKIFTKEIPLARYIAYGLIANFVLYHFPLIEYVLNHSDVSKIGGFLTLLSIVAAYVGINALSFYLLGAILGVKIRYFFAAAFFANAVAVYFVQSYGVILDRSMMGNVLNTNFEESSGYIGWTFVIYVLFLGILPAWAFLRMRIVKSSPKRLGVIALATFAASVFVLYLNSQTWLWIDKHAKYLGGLAMPWSYPINALRYEIKQSKKKKRQILLPPGTLTNQRKQIVLLIIGESARARNFSLYGYERETNPKLKRRDNLLVVPDTFSTTTYTTASVHSILSSRGKADDDYEVLPNYLQRLGVDVLWRTNNWGAPTLSVKRYEEASDIRKTACTSKDIDCNYDGVLLHGLVDAIKSMQSNKIFVVLHTSGSHGPTYYKKYPPRFEKFTPVCRSVDLKQCTQTSLINAYDNTILYTDDVIDRAIAILERFEGIETVLLYISDHGESLGEYNLYLHGTPYAIAPEVQKRIPFLIWESDAYLRANGLEAPFLRKKSRYSQGDVFHTVLGIFGIDSPVYRSEKDILRKP